MDNQQIMNLVISIAIIVVLAIFTSGFARTATAWRRNRRSPKLGAEVVVASKEKQTHHLSHGATEYAIVFRLKDDEPIKFTVPEDVYEQLNEGDAVKIIFKGTEFLEFHRLDVPQEENSSDTE